MEYNKLLKLNTIINSEEKRIIKKVLTNYNFKYIDFEKVRSAYKINTPDGSICLKKMKHGRRKVRNGQLLVKSLEEQNFCSCPQYLKSKRGKLFVSYKKYIFYATEWIDGRECNLSDIEEAKNCIQLLARFHIATSQINLDKFKLKNNLKNWPKIFNENLQNFEKYKYIIQNKKFKSKFDIKYYENINTFYKRGLISLKVLNKSNYYKMSKYNKNRLICHDSFYYQNIIRKGNDFYLIDLDSIIIDLKINDIGKFIRRLMCKKNYTWDFEKAKILIEAYNKINPISKNELLIMLSLIIFPHRFWKLGKKRYIKHKNWSEHKYEHKLEKTLLYDSFQDKFIEDYLKYVNDISSVN